MSTVYPNGIDSSSTLPTTYDNVTQVTADTVNRLRDAILNIEQALGINPQGTYTITGGVRARLDNVDTQISTLNTSVSTVVTEVNNIISNLSGEQIDLGTPSGGFLPGITTLQSTTPVTEVINTLNNLISYMAPAKPQSMQGLALDAITSLPLFVGNIAHNGSMGAGYYGIYSAGNSCTVITQTQPFTLSTHNTGDATTGFSDADKGIITLNVTNSDNTGTAQLLQAIFNLGTAFDEGYRSASSGQGSTYDGYNGSSTPPLMIVPSVQLPSVFQIYSVAMFNSFPLWQKGVAHIVNTSLTPGFNSYNVTHLVGTSTRVSQTVTLFYDNNAVSPSFSGTPTLTSNPSPTNVNYLSGIKFLTIGEILTLNATINNTFKNTYLTTPLAYTFPVGVASSTSSITDPALSGFTVSAPDVGEHITINKVFTISIPNQQTINETAHIVFTNVFGSTFTATSGNNNILINTYNSPASTATTEIFVDEFYRLKPDINGATGTSAPYPNDYVGIPPLITGQWSSTTALTNGNAQVYNAGLIYPAINFTSGYNPSQQVGSNYSGFNNTNSHGGQVYYRAMYSSSPHSSGTLTINGIVLTDLTQVSPNLKVEIKLPGSFGTGWLDLSQPFNVGSFTGATGQGCRTGNSGSTFGWTTGTFTTGDTGFMYILRITLFNATKTITSLVETFTQSF